MVGVYPFIGPGKASGWGIPALTSTWVRNVELLSKLQIPNSTPASEAYCSLKVSVAALVPSDRALTKDRKGVRSIEPTANVISAAGKDRPDSCFNP